MVAALASGTEAVKGMKTGSNLKKSANRLALNRQAEVTHFLFQGSLGLQAVTMPNGHILQL